jgi:membrane protease YdiL (CAAX protease family)
VPGAADHFFAALLVLLLPPRAWVSFRALRLASPELRPHLRRRTYIAAAASQWILCALLALYWARMRRPWSGPIAGLGVMPAITPGAIGIVIGLAIVVTLMITRWRSNEAATIERARQRLAFAEPMLPHTRGELVLFRFLSVTAGICEELLFRGFLIWYLGRYTGVIQAALLSSLAFGVGHAYQGPRGILVTAMIGAFLSGVYLLSGSLILPMIIHGLMDLHAGWLGYRAFGDRAGGGASAGGPPAEVPA